ncbi:hypothetical protein PAXRUDRAFT_826288 [Paxillus rubicundulus Ve08.2h10]|uniref:Uncharacterized protein n=1 Tax=Paxillus rubicundulus Ve08.2h10 TaxID=930991 RepID=A0A0D0DS59_9AGAM|nr:hypothetical protein PAXRUDRAFT_826288 [Paxillus rubicundulus Ve08.2h10]
MPAAKRKSDADAGASGSKKARTSHADAKALVKAILAKPDTYPILDDDDALRRLFVELARYAKDLEEEIQDGGGSSPPKTLTPDQLQAAIEKIRKAANSGIKKQMSWKASCKTGSSKWVYDGVCVDPLVFGTLLGLGGPPKFRMHKMTTDDFSDCLGGISASARYSDLYLTGSHVNIRWSDNGEFKFSGTYGTYQPPKE